MLLSGHLLPYVLPLPLKLPTSFPLKWCWSFMPYAKQRKKIAFQNIPFLYIKRGRVTFFLLVLRFIKEQIDWKSYMFSPWRTEGLEWDLNSPVLRGQKFSSQGATLRESFHLLKFFMVRTNNHWMWSHQWQCSGWDRTEQLVISPRLASPWEFGPHDLLRSLQTWDLLCESLPIP